jgi:hypothetical protein
MTQGAQEIYEHPYPSPEAAAAHPFVELAFTPRTVAEMRSRVERFRSEMEGRRSVRMLSPEPVPLDVIDTAIMAASSAPSGAHRQPWKFVVTADPAIKRQIREAAEAEERVNYEGGRMNEEWQAALAPSVPTGTRSSSRSRRGSWCCSRSDSPSIPTARGAITTT